MEGKSIGKIKWFGGHNSKTQLENKYGFIEDISGIDVFLHLDEWEEDLAPEEYDTVVYSIKPNNKKYSAINAHLLIGKKIDLYDMLELNEIVNKSQPSIVRNHIEKEIQRHFAILFEQSDSDIKKDIFSEEKKKTILYLLGKPKYSFENLSFIKEIGIVDPISELNWLHIPS